MNNKGFSLVELIIVIAIMAILIVVLAPQYLKYVERSRNSTDYQNATTVVDALQIYVADPDITTDLFVAGTVRIVMNDNLAPTVSAQNDAVEAAMENAGLDFAGMRCTSRQSWTQYTIQMIVDTDGDVTFSYASNSTGADGFAEHMGTPGGLATP
ncbi:MAG: prepilin-type N-terminal cleavage/methylation domain-containing protein [Lachnospiraceae bacterium]|nr:prepilin-type N-terminal cleavage/methylation domain-containing protein [Lachnospiraceae bacterium]